MPVPSLGHSELEQNLDAPSLHVRTGGSQKMRAGLSMLSSLYFGCLTGVFGWLKVNTPGHLLPGELVPYHQGCMLA